MLGNMQSNKETRTTETVHTFLRSQGSRIDSYCYFIVHKIRYNTEKFGRRLAGDIIVQLLIYGNNGVCFFRDGISSDCHYV